MGRGCDVMAGGTGGSRTAPTRWLSEGMRDGSPQGGARTREGVDSWLRFHGGGTSAGMTEGMA